MQQLGVERRVSKLCPAKRIKLGCQMSVKSNRLILCVMCRDIQCIKNHAGFLKRSYRYGFTKEIFHIQTITDSVTCDLFNKVKASNHCLYHLLPPQRPLDDALTVRGHQFQLPNCIYKFHKQSFIVSSLFRFLK